MMYKRAVCDIAAANCRFLRGTVDLAIGIVSVICNKSSLLPFSCKWDVHQVLLDTNNDSSHGTTGLVELYVLYRVNIHGVTHMNRNNNLRW